MFWTTQERGTEAASTILLSTETIARWPPTTVRHADLADRVIPRTNLGWRQVPYVREVSGVAGEFSSPSHMKARR